MPVSLARARDLGCVQVKVERVVESDVAGAVLRWPLEARQGGAVFAAQVVDVGPAVPKHQVGAEGVHERLVHHNGALTLQPQLGWVGCRRRNDDLAADLVLEHSLAVDGVALRSQPKRVEGARRLEYALPTG